MPLPRRADFANDNHPLTAGDRDAIGMALDLPDAHSLRSALREKLAAIRLRARPPRAYKGPNKPARLATPVGLVIPWASAGQPAFR